MNAMSPSGCWHSTAVRQLENGCSEQNQIRFDRFALLCVCVMESCVANEFAFVFEGIPSKTRQQLKLNKLFEFTAGLLAEQTICPLCSAAPFSDRSAVLNHLRLQVCPFIRQCNQTEKDLIHSVRTAGFPVYRRRSKQTKLCNQSINIQGRGFSGFVV